MEFGDILLAALVSSGVTVAVLALLGAGLKTTVTRMIGHQFDIALEQTKSTLKRDDEEFRSALAAHSQRIEAIQRQAFAAAGTRNAALQQRRIEAAAGLWDAVIELSGFASGVAVTQDWKLLELQKTAATETQEGRKFRDFAKKLNAIMGLSIDKFKPAVKPERYRLFVSPIVWALFSTYQSLVFDPAARLQMMELGAPADLMKDGKELTEAVRAALPDRAGFIDQLGYRSLAHLVEPLRERLFAALIESLEQPDADARNVEQATEILTLVDKATAGRQAAVSAATAPA